MEFFIRQGATRPLLKLEIIDNGIDDYSSFNDDLENAEITFDMIEVESGMEYILGSECNLTYRTKKYDQTTEEYYIFYTFTEEDTFKKGRFEGKINIKLRDTNLNSIGNLILPLKEKLFINII